MEAWKNLAPRVIQRLSQDLSITPQQAAGIVGHLGHESAGLQAINEYQPVVPNSRGGFGWAQWTGPRRRQFESWAKDRGLDVKDPEANYGFLVHELTNTPEKRALEAVRAAPDAISAGRAFTDTFLRPGTPAYKSRDLWTKRALNFISSSAHTNQRAGLSNLTEAQKRLQAHSSPANGTSIPNHPNYWVEPPELPDATVPTRNAWNDFQEEYQMRREAQPTNQSNLWEMTRAALGTMSDRVANMQQQNREMATQMPMNTTPTFGQNLLNSLSKWQNKNNNQITWGQ